MKIYSEEPKPEFKPVIIRLESQDEVDMIEAVFNFSPINDILDRERTKGISKSILDGLEKYTSEKAMAYWDLLENGLTRR